MKRFQKPTLAQIKLQCAKIGLPESEGEAFEFFYESKGWKVGKSPMVSWVAALSGWRHRWRERHPAGEASKPFIERYQSDIQSPLFPEDDEPI